MNRKTEVYIKCPFYEHEKDNRISCEGFLKNTVMITKFPDAKEKRRHLQKFCYCENGGCCPMAVSLFEKYKMLEEKADTERLNIARERLELLKNKKKISLEIPAKSVGI